MNSDDPTDGDLPPKNGTALGGRSGRSDRISCNKASHVVSGHKRVELPIFLFKIALQVYLPSESGVLGYISDPQPVTLDWLDA